MDLADEKCAAAEAAALLVEDGMTVGLGPGSTVAYLLTALARRRLTILCVATSVATESAARALGLRVEPFGTEGLDRLDRLDIAIDGADQIDPDGWLVKGGGGAHTREKIVAASADRFVVIADSSKTVAAINGPIPVELLAFGLASTLRREPHLRVRDAAPPSPDGGVIGDWFGPVGDGPGPLAVRLAAVSGIVEHGLFPPSLVHDVLVANGAAIADVAHRRIGPSIGRSTPI